ncbi:MAG: MFS transporter [Steroidobacteraceae bacterium]
MLVLIGASMFNILPLITAGAADKLAFSADQVGVMSSVLTVTSGISSLLAGLWVRSVSWPRAAATSLASMGLCLLLALGAHRFWLYASLQGAAGFFASAAFSLGMTVISDGRDSARGFGAAMAAQAAYQIGALWAGPMLLRLPGVSGVLLLLAIPAGLAMTLAPLLPARGRPTPPSPRGGLSRPAVLLTFLGAAIFFVGAGAYWTYIELMGQARGMSSQLIADWIAVSVAAGIPGGMLASAQGSRFGSLAPLALATGLVVLAALLLSAAHGGALAFGVAGILYCFAWCYALAYQFAFVNIVDTTGRAVAVTGACGSFGTAAGALLAALFVTPNDYGAVIWIAAVAACLSVGMYALSALLHARAAGTESHMLRGISGGGA